jgi:CTP:molybdopterin cytidylyltransferase MocA
MYVVLASGQGTRMGGPKALLLYNGATPLAVAHVRALRAQGVQAVVVTRACMARALLRFDPTVHVVVSEAAEEQGPAGSIAALVRARVLDEYDGALLSPVDLVPSRASTIRALVDALRRGADAACPCYAGRGGHPVAIRTDALLKAYETEPPPTLRDVLAGMGPTRVFVSVDDPDVRTNLDTPDAWLARTGRSPSFWT